MIGLRSSKDFCKDYTKIENYETAVNDTTQTWHCHHRLETHFSDGTPRPKSAQLLASELEALGMYYDRPPEELIYLSVHEHMSLHNKEKVMTDEHRSNLSKALVGNDRVLGRRWYNNGIISVMRYECPEGFIEGRIKPSEETRKKMSKANKGKNKGKTLSEEIRRHLSEVHKGMKHSEENKRKMSEAKKGQHWKLVDGKRVWY